MGLTSELCGGKANFLLTLDMVILFGFYFWLLI